MPERIASNTLADRLEKLTGEGMLVKTRSKRNRLIYHYNITEKGLDLIPIIKAVIDWSEKYLYKEEEKKELTEIMNLIKGNINFS
ncbi:MAG: winged helix-turn-helix transcriptional regulator, partial [Cruoricaptor ignavus]|nr:winged helix-turn-helix transcriptional regulator [Cruoricaptor ignavus]